MELKPNVVYVVTKASDDGSFRLNEHIILKEDGRIWIGEDLVEAEGIPIATVGLEVVTYDSHYREKAESLLKSRATETLELIESLAATYDDNKNYVELATTLFNLRSRAEKLLNTMEVK